MSDSDKFLKMFGAIFFSVGVVVGIIGIVGFAMSGFIMAGIPILIGVVFGSIGGGILISQMKKTAKRKNVEANGNHFLAKIYGYVEDHSCTMNGAYLMNTKVHYFDEYGVEREAILETGFARGCGDYPIGATIEIIALGNAYSWIPNSVRYERIEGEDELMDDKPVNQILGMTAISCGSCGASFTAAKGYTSTCPYCGSSINA